MRFPLVVCVFLCVAVMIIPTFGQSPNGNINGLVADPTNAAVADAEIVAVNDVTGVQYTTKTNSEGIYVLPNLPPGPYRVQVSKIGFKTLIKPDITLNVQDSLSINFTLLVGAFHEIVTVQSGAPLVNTENATVSTVVDRQFAENLPMNGRSFQTLIELTPGVVLTPSSTYDSGQFSVNGQRASSNYWMLDGVSANIGISPFSSPGNGFGGTLGSFSALGGTNSLVSVDAMQEFRVQTSSFAPEFGRTPGGQISIVTRSGTNQFHGTLFDYFRNNVLDAENWFNGYTNDPPLPKAEERQNDFGGTFSGPILKQKTFFFFSYEGLRLRLPQTELTTVPDTNARLSAAPALQPYFNAYPEPNGPELGQGIAEFNASFSNAATLDAYSLRLDHNIGSKLSLFGRYDNSPSQLLDRGSDGSAALSVLFPSSINTRTGTLGSSWLISSVAVNDLRLNYSRTRAKSYYYMDDLGGAVPIQSPPFPLPYTPSSGNFAFEPFSLTSGAELTLGQNASNLQEQINVVENFSLHKGSHGLKFGVDFLRLSPHHDPVAYVQQAFFLDIPSAEAGSVFESSVGSALSTRLLFQSLGAFAEDAWQVLPRLTLTYGLRWDIDFAPSSLAGPNFLAVTGYNLNNLSNLALAPAGTSPFATRYGNIAPRIGVASTLSQKGNFETVLRGGFGLFFDLPSSEAGVLASLASYPFGALAVNLGGTFPLDPASAEPPAITPSYLSSAFGVVGAFDPNLQLPYTLEWNLSLQQALGQPQSVTASYVGSSGRRLIQSAYVVAPTPNIGNAYLVGNSARSNYNALQLQYQRRLSSGLQAVASYSLSRSIDDASAGSVFGNTANAAVPGVNPASNRGPSDFDVRHAVTAGFTYDIPFPDQNRIWKSALSGWSTESFIVAHSAMPVSVTDVLFSTLFNGYTSIRPDLVPGTPVYIHGSQCVAVFQVSCAGGMGFNPAAFTNPPVDPATGLPLRQGTLSRNALQGFGLTEWDLAVHRDIPIHDTWKLQFRVEAFNVLNHPNFGPPNAGFGTGSFGLATQMLGQSLNSNNVGGGAFSPLYQVGGPRSGQLALKLVF